MLISASSGPQADSAPARWPQHGYFHFFLGISPFCREPIFRVQSEEGCAVLPPSPPHQVVVPLVAWPCRSNLQKGAFKRWRRSASRAFWHCFARRTLRRGSSPKRPWHSFDGRSFSMHLCLTLQRHIRGLRLSKLTFRITTSQTTFLAFPSAAVTVVGPVHFGGGAFLLGGLCAPPLDTLPTMFPSHKLPSQTCTKFWIAPPALAGTLVAV